MTVLQVSDLAEATGLELGLTAWVTVDQDRIDLFAQVTHDEQWIHCDPARAADGPFGAPIAHGFLTVSHCSDFLTQLLRVEDAALTINYGLDRVRFPAPVVVGSRIRGTATLTATDEIEGGVQSTITMTIESDRVDRPVCVAEMVVRFMGPAAHASARVR